MNRTTLALTDEQFETIISTIRSGYDTHRPNRKLATILILQGNMGLRISDILRLTLESIVEDGSRYRFDIVEKKTSKQRTFTVPNELYTIMQEYALDNRMTRQQRLFPITERSVQKSLKEVVEHLGYTRIGTHSFRKYFATRAYNQNHNIELVRRLLQHSYVSTTQRYIGISDAEIEDTLQSIINIK